MKNIKLFSGLILILSALFLGGCYTQIAMNDNGDNNGNDNYGYNNDQNSQDYQTPADTTYGNQYDTLDNQYEPNTINNYYFGYPRYSGSFCWGNYPSYSVGINFGFPYYNPYYWDPFGLWSYYPTYYNPYYYNPYSYYGGYYNPYYYGNYGYYGYYGNYNSGTVQRSNSTTRLRNNDGFRSGGDRGIVTGTNGNTSVPTANTTRNEPSGRTVTTTRSSSGQSVYSNNRNNGRVVGRSVESGRNNSGRTISRQNYRMERKAYTRTYDRNNNNRNNSGYNSNSNRNNSNNNYGNQRSSGRYEAPRTYSPPPQSSYSPPPTRSSSPPPARSSSGSSSRGSSGRRGR